MTWLDAHGALPHAAIHALACGRRPIACWLPALSHAEPLQLQSNCYFGHGCPAGPARSDAFAAASYLCLTGFDALAVRYAGRPLPYRRVALASFVSLTIGHNIGFDDDLGLGEAVEDLTVE